MLEHGSLETEGVDEAQAHHLRWSVIRLLPAVAEPLLEIDHHLSPKGVANPISGDDQHTGFDLTLIGPNELIVQGAHIERGEPNNRDEEKDEFPSPPAIHGRQT